MDATTESGEFASSGAAAIQANPSLRHTAFMKLERLNLPKEGAEGVRFVTDMPVGWRFCGSVVIRQGSYVPPTRDECIKGMPPIFREEACGMKDPTTVDPVFCNGEYIFVIPLFRSPDTLS